MRIRVAVNGRPIEMHRRGVVAKKVEAVIRKSARIAHPELLSKVGRRVLCHIGGVGRAGVDDQCRTKAFGETGRPGARLFGATLGLTTGTSGGCRIA